MNLHEQTLLYNLIRLYRFCSSNWCARQFGEWNGTEIETEIENEETLIISFDLHSGGNRMPVVCDCIEARSIEQSSILDSRLLLINSIRIRANRLVQVLRRGVILVCYLKQLVAPWGGAAHK